MSRDLTMNLLKMTVCHGQAPLLDLRPPTTLSSLCTGRLPPTPQAASGETAELPLLPPRGERGNSSVSTGRQGN